MLKSIWTGIIDIIFPRNCILCRAYHPATSRDPLCPDCREKLPWNTPPFCVRCSRHLSGVASEELCPSCRAHPPHFDEGWAMLRYEGHGREILHRFKFHNKTSLCRTCAVLFSEFSARFSLTFPDTAIVIPVPLHPARLRERGYNQSGLFAASIARKLGLPLYENILQRQRHTDRQSKLEAKDRWTNILGAFKMKNLTDIVGREIILVDDILTTGATASEAAKTLKDAGASRVTVITLAIASCGSFATTS